MPRDHGSPLARARPFRPPPLPLATPVPWPQHRLARGARARMSAQVLRDGVPAGRGGVRRRAALRGEPQRLRPVGRHPPPLARLTRPRPHARPALGPAPWARAPTAAAPAQAGLAACRPWHPGGRLRSDPAAVTPHSPRHACPPGPWRTAGARRDSSHSTCPAAIAESPARYLLVRRHGPDPRPNLGSGPGPLRTGDSPDMPRKFRGRHGALALPPARGRPNLVFARQAGVTSSS